MLLICEYWSNSTMTYPLWEGCTIGTATAASWAVTRQTSGALSISERKTPQLLKGVNFSILIYRYDVVTPFGREGQEGPTLLTTEPRFDRMVIMNQIALWISAGFLPLGLVSSGGHWCWRWRTLGAFSIRERKMPHLFMGTSEFDGDIECEKDYWKV